MLEWKRRHKEFREVVSGMEWHCLTGGRRMMGAVIEVEGLVKHFGDFTAVDDVSFTVEAGEIFGMLGPNGAGKTTTIRMLLDILRPDAGRIAIFGGAMNEEKKSRLGYLPEERGLYQDMSLQEVLVFLGALKGLSMRTVRQRVEERLREVDLWEERKRKIGALSRGMNQKAQFVATTLHDPDLVILDEPFSGLDPVNVRLIKDLIYRMRDRGVAIIMSTHQMQQIEEMADRIMLVNQGKRVLYGPVDDVRRRYSGNAIEIKVRGTLSTVEGVQAIQQNGEIYRLMLEEGVASEQVLRRLVETTGIVVERYQLAEVSLDEIFIRVVGGAAKVAS